MIALGAGACLFFSSIVTVAVTALDPSRSSLAGGILYMCEVAGGAVGLGLDTVVVLHGATLADGMRTAFRMDGVPAPAGLVALRLLGRRSVDRSGGGAGDVRGRARRRGRMSVLRARR